MSAAATRALPSAKGEISCCEERTDLLVDVLKFRDGEVVADIGCGSGFISRKIAGKIGKTGTVYGVEIQQEMLDLLMKNMKRLEITTVKPVLGALFGVRMLWKG